MLDKAWEGLAESSGASHVVVSTLPGHPCMTDVSPCSQKSRERSRRQLRAWWRSGLGCRSSDAFGVEPWVSHGLQFPCRLQDMCPEGVPKGPPGSHISMSAIWVCFQRSSTCGPCHFAEAGRQEGPGVVAQLSSSRFHEKPGFSLALLSGGLGPSG